MVDEWKPPIRPGEINLCDDDDVQPSVSSPAAGSSSKDVARPQRDRAPTDRTPASYSSLGPQAKGKAKGRPRDVSPQDNGARAGAVSKKARKSDAALDTEMEKYEDKRVAELKKTYHYLVSNDNEDRVANLELIFDAATAGESSFISLLWLSLH